MIGCFPDPYPDELLYSLCARFHERVQYPNKKSTVRELFSDAAAIAIVDLPSNLGNLVAALPFNTHYTVERLIDNQTLLPFFTPFLSPKQVRKLRMDMKGSRGPAIHMRSGLMASTLQPPQWLRFCPECAGEDRQVYGECYWHRLHQLTGVEVCSKHKLFLVNSQVRIQNPKTRHEFVAADNAIQLSEEPQPLQENLQHQILLRIAQDANWLIQHSHRIAELEVLSSRYRNLLADKALATYNGRVRVSKLLQEFLQFYSPELLQQLQCEIDGNSQHNWLYRLVRSPKGSQHPIRHLLLIQFLGHTVESFFNLRKPYPPFGNGPWLCLNKAAAHCGQEVIPGCDIAYSQEHGKPIGKFICSCGFIYARTGPDVSEEDRLRITKVIAFGSVWEAALEELWNNPSFSLREIARQLGVDPTTVKLHAAKLGLKFPRQGKRQTNKSQRVLANSDKVEHSLSSISVEAYRSEWLAARANNMQAGRTVLRKQFSRVYTWLRRNDRDWLEANQPPKQLHTVPPPRIDWEQRDIELASIIEQTAQRLKNQSERPLQITIAAIARETGHLALIQKHLDKLPLTETTLTLWVETREESALRRIEWVVSRYREEGICPLRWKLIRRAGLRREIEALPQVQAAIEKALQFLEFHMTSAHEIPQSRPMVLQ